MTIEHPKEQHESPVERFQKEIAELASREKKKAEQWEYRERSADTYSRDAVDIEAEFLTEEDRAIWENIQNKTITFPEFHEYGQAMNQALREEKKTATDMKEYESKKKSRKAFRAIAADRAQIAFRDQDRENASRHTSVE